ncbi:MAG: TIGR03435 family protein [Acidobacteriota bacterium]|nr:TIGR03435 family protein [Acidobacteriota bacterium]
MHCFYCKLSVVAAVVLSAPAAITQPTPNVSIEVSVVRPHPPGVIHNNFSFNKNRFELEDQPLAKMIAFAYSLNARQIVGAPGWVSEDHWDMSGKTDLTEDATLPQQQAIIRQLLVERFGLQFHKEKRELPSYALRILKEQPKLTLAADPAAQPGEWTQGHDWVRTENYRSCSMGDFLIIKQLLLDRPLVDQTGLVEKYDFKLTYSYGDAPSTDADAPPSMFTAIKEQLALKFEPVKASVDVIVVDHIGRPTPN